MRRAGAMGACLAGIALAGCSTPPNARIGAAALPVNAGHGAPNSPVTYKSPGLPMEERLKQIAQTIDPGDLMFLNKQRAESLRAQLEGQKDVSTVLLLLPDYVRELIASGQTEESLRQLDRLDSLLREHDPVQWRQTIREYRFLKATAYLRLGEQDNCLKNHTGESCILPIKGGGIHVAQRGSRGAIAVLTDMLKHMPNDLSARWLLNIAYMTVGEYPAHVPKLWLIPPEVFKSDGDVGHFREIGGEVGLDVNGLSGGVIIEDFDGDGNLDVVTSAIGVNDPLHYFHNNGDGTFTDRTKEAGLEGETGGLNLIQTDYDNDGRPDILVLRGGWFGSQGHHPLSLLKNNGGGTFTDVTEQAGLLRFRPTQTAVWFDYNNDGWLDLFVGNETRGQNDINPCELFRNNGDGTFTEVGHEVGADFGGFVKAVVSADYDNDGRPDLYLSVQGGKNVLLHNDGPAGTDHSPRAPWKFTNVAERAGVTEPINSFPAIFFDYDNDGWPDLFVSGYQYNNAEVGLVAADYLGMPIKADYPRLYHNERNGTFKDVTREAHLNKLLFGMGINCGDLDNDGRLDLYVGTGTPGPSFLVPNRMFRNADGKVFQDVTTSGGFGHLQKGHGIAFADLNNDGSQDVYEEMGGGLSGDTAVSALYENPGHSNHWITLKLEGVRSNRAAVGARVRVVVNTPSGQRSLYRTVGSGGSFGAGPFRLEIGLGASTSVDRAEIFWPATGITQTIRGLNPHHFYKLREGDSAPTPLDLRAFPFARGAGVHHHHPGMAM